MNLRRRLARLDNENRAEGKACYCVPAHFVVTIHNDSGAGPVGEARDAARTDPRCPKCGGLAEGYNVFVVRDRPTPTPAEP
jgi:hypothetical protein